MKASSVPTCWPRPRVSWAARAALLHGHHRRLCGLRRLWRLIAPIIEDKPFAESLTFETGVRYSKYEIDGAGGNEDLDLEGRRQLGAGLGSQDPPTTQQFRARTLKLFTPQTVGLTNLGVDPCQGNAGAQCRPSRNLPCTGCPAGSIGSITPPSAAQVNVVGGNMDLNPKANIWTLSVVFVPEFLPKFSMSIDCYSIRIKDVIASALRAMHQRLLQHQPRPARPIRTA